MGWCSHGVDWAKLLISVSNWSSAVTTVQSKVWSVRDGSHSAGSPVVELHLVQRGEHLECVVVEPLGAVLELLVGVGRGGCAEHITGLEVPMPAAQPFKALFLLFQLRQGELALRDLFVDLDVELAAVGEELRPLVLALSGEQLTQAGGVGLAAPGRLEYHDLARTALGQLDHPRDALGEDRHVRRQPRPLSQRYRSDSPQLPPHRHAVPRWRSG